MSLFGTGRRETVLAALLLVALGLVLHLPGLAFGHHRHVFGADAAIAHRDVLATEGAWNSVVLYPALLQAGAAWRGGELPLWNPDARLGEPFSFSGAPLWYPPYWLLLADLGPWSFELLLALHTVIAALAMFRFLQVMTLSRYVTFLGGAAYGLGWFMTASLDRLPEAAAAAILPFALECTWRCLSWRRGSQCFVVGLAFAVAAMFAAGGTTTAWLGVSVCAVVLVVGLSAVERDHRMVAMRLAGFAAAGATLLLAPYWLEWLQHAGSAQGAQSGPVHPNLRPTGMLGLLGPGLFGDLRGNAPHPLVEISPAADPLEQLLYPGAFVLFAGLLGLLRPKRSYQGLFWLLVAGAGLLLSVENPLHALVGWAPDRRGASLVLFHLGAVVIASISLETFFDNPLARPFATSTACTLSILFAVALVTCGFLVPAWGDALLATLAPDAAPTSLTAVREFAASRLIGPAACLALLAIAFLTWRRVGILRFKPALAIIVLLDLLLHATIAVPRSTEPPVGTETAALLPASEERAIRVGRNTPHPPASWLAARGHRSIDTPGTAILERTACLLGTVDAGCLHVRPQRAEIKPLLTPELLDDPLLALAGVGVATSTLPTSSEEFVPLVARPDIAAPRGPLVLTRRHPRPRARIAYDDVFVTSTADARFVLRRHVEPEAVVLEGPPRELDTKRPTEPASIEWLEDTANRIALRVDMREGRGYLVLCDAFAAGWHVRVDGAATEILPADLALRAVPLREGEHEVVFTYAPWSWRLGVPLLVLGGCMALGYGIVQCMLRGRR